MDKLQQSLLNAKRFMNHNALNGPTKNTPREPSTISEDRMMQMPPNFNIKDTAITPPVTQQMSMTPKSQMSKDAILSSRLPDAIKKAMIENPIPDPIPANTLSPQFINEVSKKMNSKEYSIDEMRATSNSNVLTDTGTTIIEDPPASNYTDPIPPLSYTPEASSLKEVIKECLTEILQEENLLVEQKTIKEHLQLRVGNKIFTGTLKSVKTIKK